MFQNGHNHGNHKNHWKGGRLTKDQREKLNGQLVAGSSAIDFVFAYEPKDKEKLDWYKLKADCFFKVLNKFSADKVEEIKELTVSDKLLEFEKNYASRISGLSIGLDRPGENTHNQKGLQPEH